jgi:CelD/BcsL family acetyltransferase involved in cellulose biosynthesis
MSLLRSESMNPSFVHFPSTLSEWGRILDSLPERTIFQTPEWLSFVAKAQHGKILLCTLQSDGQTLGYFAGVLVKKMGLTILGSPLPGWTTSYMGLNLIRRVSRVSAVHALMRFAFDELGCVHLEMMDRNLGEEDVNELGMAHNLYCGFEVDLTQTEERLLAKMTSGCRQCIRKAEKSGVTVHEADDSPFADDYYEQLREVFRKQQLVPTYPVDRVHELIACVHGTGRLLLLRARDPQGRCIATGIFPAMNGTMYFWGGASWQAFQGYRPNEALHWYAMRYWKARGMTRYDMGGGGVYKKKFGGHEINIPWLRVSKYPVLPFVRDLSKHLLSWRQSALGLISR